MNLPPYMTIVSFDDNMKFCDRAAKIGALHPKLGIELYKKYYNSGLTSISLKGYIYHSSIYRSIIKEDTYENESERG